MGHAEQERGKPAPVMADQPDPVKAQRIQQGARVRGEAVRVITCPRCLAPAEAAQVRHQEPVPAASARHHVAPHEPVLRPAVQQQHRLASARFGEVNPDPAGRAGHIHQTVPHRWRRGKAVRHAGRGYGSHADKLAPPTPTGQQRCEDQPPGRRSPTQHGSRAPDGASPHWSSAGRAISGGTSRQPQRPADRVITLRQSRCWDRAVAAVLGGLAIREVWLLTRPDGSLWRSTVGS
jgi:hypothetical protein